jgi:outer membrane protein
VQLKFGYQKIYTFVRIFAYRAFDLILFENMRILKNCFSVIIIAVFVGIPDYFHAQEAWTLERCIKYAVENNIQVKQQEILVEQQEVSLLQSKYNLIPSLSAGTGYSMGWGRVLDQTTNDFVEGPRQENANINLSSSVVLFAGLQKQNLIKRNKINLQANIQDVEKLKNDISLNVAAAFLQILLSQEALSIAEEQLVSTREQLAKTQKMVDAGKLTLSNLLELQAQQAAEEAAVTNAKNNLDINYITLTQLLELPDARNFAIAKPQLPELPSEFGESTSVQGIYENALSFQPTVKGAELRLESARRYLSIAKGQYYPSLSLSASISSRYSNTNMDPSTGYQRAFPFWDQWSNNQNTGVSLNLSIPIFSGLQIRSEVKNAKLNVRTYELDLQRTKNNLYKEIQQAQADAAGQLKNYHASQKNVEAMRESFRYTEKKFDVGLVTSTDYVVAKNNLFKAQSDNIQAKYQYVFKMKILDFYKGLQITL